MDLRRMKTIFIFILIGINILLMLVLVGEKNSRNEEKRIIEQNLSNVLAKNMIYLSDSVEISDSPDIANFYIEKMFGSDNDMIRNFLGADYKSNGNGSFESESGVLFFEEDEFRFRKKKIQGEKVAFSEKKIEKLCRAEMEKIGMMQSVYEFNGFNYVENGTRAIFTVKHNNAEFFDAYVSFDVSEEGIFAVSGKNLISNMEVVGGESSYFSLVSVLADMAANDKLDKNLSHIIVSIKPGYYIGKSEESYRNILAIPVWQIATDKGIILHYDARNGKLIQE